MPDEPVRLSGGSTWLESGAETPPPNWGARVSQSLGGLPPRLATLEERIAAARLRISGWDVQPGFDVRQCEEPYDSGSDSMECLIELRHFGDHRWMIEGSTVMQWPQR